MGLWLLANTVGRDAADLRVTNFSNAEQTSEQDGIDNLRGGPRSLKYTTQSTSTRNILYLNKAGTLSATHIVIAGANALEGINIEVLGWVVYSSGASVLVNDASFNEPTYGIDGTDWVYKWGVGENNRDGFQLVIKNPGTTLSLKKVYFCNGLEFDYAVGPVQFTRVPVSAPAVAHCGNFYKLHATATMVLGPITRAQLDTFYSLPLEDPVFFYDDTGDTTYGDYIPHKLWHALVLGQEVTVAYQDGSSELVFVQFELGILKHSNG